MANARDDSALLRAARTDAAAFEAFYVRWAPPLHAWLRSRVRDAETANDLTAETFAQALLSLGAFRGKHPGEGVAWLWGVGRHVLHQHYRTSRLERSARRRLGIPSRSYDAGAWDDVDARVTATALARELTAALDGLSEGQRRAVEPAKATIIAEPPFDLADWSATGARAAVERDGQLHLESPPGNSTKGLERTVHTAGEDAEFLLDVSALHFSEHASNFIQMLNWTLREAGSARGLSLVVHRSFTRTVSLSAQGDEERAVDLGTVDDVHSLQLRALWRAAARQWTISYAVNGTAPFKPLPGGPLFDAAADGPVDAWTEVLTAATFSLDQDPSGASDSKPPPEGLDALISRHVIRRYDPLADPPADIVTIRSMPADQRSARQSRALEEYYLAAAPRFSEWNRQIDELEVLRRRAEVALPHSLVTVATTPRVTRILHRGDWLDESGEIVSPAVPAFLAALPAGDAPADRLALARWLVSPQNPLTARVLVNRLWKICFGRGIVRSLDDFGSQGSRPSDPELLDWLAAELIDSNWNIKHLLRLIVTSNTYRQSSAGALSIRTEMGEIAASRKRTAPISHSFSCHQPHPSSYSWLTLP
jgi:DNA-directed RNA polymerase specialized sigma24 family protein